MNLFVELNKQTKHAGIYVNSLLIFQQYSMTFGSEFFIREVHTECIIFLGENIFPTISPMRYDAIENSMCIDKIFYIKFRNPVHPLLKINLYE